MSAKNGADEAQHAALALIPLLKEYAEKIHQYGLEIDTINGTEAFGKNSTRKNQRALQSLQFGFLRLKAPLTQLAQHASQLVEHGNIDPVTRLELALRNAEFEAALNEAESALRASKKLVG